MTRILKTVGAVVLLTLIGCSNFTLPKKAQVIANPTYNLGLGETSFALKDYFSVQKMQEMFGGGEGNASSQVAVYDYIPNPAENIQQYAIHYSLGKIDFNVGSYLEDTNFDDINIDIPEQQIQIPTVDLTQTQPILKELGGQTVSSNWSVPVKVSLDTPNSSDDVSVKKLVVGKGFLNIRASNFDGVSFNVDEGKRLTLTIGDEDREVEPSEDGKSGTFDLTGVTLIDTTDNEGFQISGDVKLTGGTVPDGGIEIEITGSIVTFESVSVELPEDVTGQLEKIIDVDVTEMAKSVSSVTFNKVGAEGTFYSTLPEGNEFYVSVKSDPLELEILEQKISSGEQSVDFTADKKTLAMNSLTDNTLPFTVSVGLPKDNDGYYRFVNVKAGDTYTIEAQLKAVLDWSEVSIKQSAFAGADSPLNGEMRGIDLSSLKTTMDELFTGQTLSNQIEFTEIGIYPFITKPTGDILNNIEASGVIQMTYTNKDGNNKIFLVGNSDGSAGKIKLVEKGPALPESSDKPYTQDLDKAADAGEVSIPMTSEEKAKISDMLNAYPSDLALVYDVGITGAGGGDITVSKEDIDKINESGGTTSISMDVVLTVPLRIKLRGNAVTINMKPVDKDLLIRDGVSGIDENIRKIFNSLEQVTLAVDYENNFGSGLTVKVKNTPTETSNGMSIKDATFEYEPEELVASGSQTLKIEIKGSDIKDKILGAYPFAPEITVELTGEKEKDSDDTLVKIPREAELSADLRFSAGASINGVYDFTKGTFEIVEGN